MSLSSSGESSPARRLSTDLHSAAILAITGIIILLSSCSDKHDTVPSDDPLELSPAQQDALPEDCVWALRPAAEVYCYSPQSASLQAVERDGSLLWQKLLTGDTTDLRVSAVSIVDERILLIISTINENGLWQHALQAYLPDGTPEGSEPILTPFRELVNGGLASFAWNIAGEPLQVASDGTSVFIVASVYRRISTVRDNRPGDWTASGWDALMRIEPASGERLAYRRLAGSATSAPEILANGDVRLSIDESTRTFDAATLADRSTPDDGLVLRSDKVPLLMPRLYAWADGTRLDTFQVGVQAALSGSDDVESPADPPCLTTTGADTPGCTGEITSGPSIIECPLGGTATHTFYKATAYLEGKGVTLIDKLHSIQFEACRLSSVNNASLTNGEYMMSGLYQKDTSSESPIDVVYSFEQLDLRQPDGNINTITGSVHEFIYAGSHFNQTRTFTISNADSGDEVIDKLSVVTFRASTHGGLTNSVRGTLTWRGPLSDGVSIDMTVDPTLYGHWPYSDPATGMLDGSRIEMSGALELTAADGSAVTITVEEDPAVNGSYQLLYDVMGEGRVYNVPFESLLVPFFLD